VDALAARNLLAGGNVPTTLPKQEKPEKSVEENVEGNTFLKVRDGFVAEDTGLLKPGQRHELLYRVAPNTTQVVVTVSDVHQALPQAQQNQFYGDNLLVAVHSSENARTVETSFFGGYNVFEYTLTGGTWVINDLQPGIMRITLNADVLAAGDVSGHVRVYSTSEPLPRFTTHGKISNLQTVVVPVTIPPGTSLAEFQLSWREDWSRYPSNDIDMHLVAPGGAVSAGGATLRSPELVKITNPAPGTWQVILLGFSVFGGDEMYELRVELDGKIVK